jgi:hypothetical protein
MGLHQQPILSEWGFLSLNSGEAKNKGGREMNTVDSYLTSVEFGDCPFAPANMFKIQGFWVSQHLPRRKF